MTRTDRELRDFLMGRLPEALVESIEQEALRDEATFEQLEALEDELVFDYARGTVTPEERCWLETHTLAASGGATRLAQARSMLEAFDRLAEPRATSRAGPSRPLVWAGLAAAAALILALGLQTWSLQNAIADTRQELARANSEVERLATAAQAPQNPPGELPTAAPGLPILALSLTPGLVRGSSTSAELRVPADAAAVLELRLTLPAGAPPSPYRFAVVNPDGVSILAGAAPTSANRQVLLQIPATHTPPDDYEVVLSAADGEEVAAYAFSIRRKNP